MSAGLLFPGDLLSLSKLVITFSLKWSQGRKRKRAEAARPPKALSRKSYNERHSHHMLLVKVYHKALPNSNLTISGEQLLPVLKNKKKENKSNKTPNLELGFRYAQSLFFYSGLLTQRRALQGKRRESSDTRPFLEHRLVKLEEILQHHCTQSLAIYHTRSKTEMGSTANPF